jgi:hypothetical protein
MSWPGLMKGAAFWAPSEVDHSTSHLSFLNVAAVATRGSSSSEWQQQCVAAAASGSSSEWQQQCMAAAASGSSSAWQQQCEPLGDG